MDNIENKLVSSDSDGEIEFSSRKKNRKQAFRIEESDSDELENLTTVNETATTGSTSKIISENESGEQSGSDVSNAADDDIELSSRRKKKKKKRSDDRKKTTEAISKINSLCDQDSSSDESDKEINMDTVPKTKKPPISKINALWDKDSSSDGSDKQINTDTVPKTRAPQRMSAKQAEEQMKIIQSESQRMARECNLSVPYHRPKQHSLKDFLNRKTINKPIPMTLTKKAAATIKMSKEELEQYAKSLEDRNKESQEFYRSDSDESAIDDTHTNSKTEAELVDLEVDVNEQQNLARNIGDIEELREEIHLELDVIQNCTDSTVNEPTLNDNVDIPEKASDNCSNHKTIEIDYDFGEDDANAKNASTRFNSVMKPCLKGAVNGIIDLDFDDAISKNASTRFNSIVKPCLKGPVNGIIDLDFDDVISTKSGGDELFERFIRNVAKKPTRTEREISILSTDNGVIELKNLKIESEDQNCIHSKPRTDFFKLKEELSLRIAAKRKEELLKKQIAVKEVVAEDDDSDLESRMERKLSENELKVVEIDECEGSEKLSEENQKDEETNVDENDEEKCVDEGEDDNPVDNEDDDESDDEYGNKIECDPHESNESMKLMVSSSDDENVIEFPKQRKRIVVMDNSDDEKPNESQELVENGDDVNSNSQGEQQIDQTKSQISKNQDLADRMIDSCSEIVPEKNHLGNNIVPLYTQTTDNISESQLLDLCSGTFATQPIDTCEASPAGHDSEQNSYNLSDNEFSDDDIGLPNKAKQRKRINISDDETENTSQDDKAITKDDNDESDAAEEYLSDEETEAKIVEYDSEENEIEVSVEPKRKISEFFENEAELSESDWGSADEDENNLDKFEMELGDEDEFDQDKLRSDIEKIHRRRMADQDAREVRIITDKLFEDEEENGLGRQRQFKWKHMENSLNIEENNVADNDDAVVKSDDENEETWRRMRHERNHLLQEAKNQNDVVVLADETMTTKTKKRISIIKNPVNVNNSVTKDLSFLISKMKEDQAHRSSILIRDAATLANLSKIISDDGIPSINANSKNFLFNVISSDDGKSLGKRKLDRTIDEDVENKNKTQKTKRVKKSTFSVLDSLYS